MTSASPTRRLDPIRTATASVATPSSVCAASQPPHARGRMPLPLATAHLASPAPASVDPAGANETTRARTVAPPPTVCGHAFPAKEPQRFSCFYAFLFCSKTKHQPVLCGVALTEPRHGAFCAQFEKAPLCPVVDDSRSS